MIKFLTIVLVKITKQNTWKMQQVKSYLTVTRLSKKEHCIEPLKKKPY